MSGLIAAYGEGFSAVVAVVDDVGSLVCPAVQLGVAISFGIAKFRGMMLEVEAVTERGEVFSLDVGAEYVLVPIAGTVVLPNLLVTLWVVLSDGVETPAS